MSQPNPNDTDTILGGQNPPPVNVAILGGLAGVKQRLENGSIAERIQALNNASQYGDRAINVFIQSLADSVEEVRKLSHILLLDLVGETKRNNLFRNLSSQTNSQPQLLREIATSSDLQTLKNLSINLNTPPTVLSILGNTSKMDALLNVNIDRYESLRYKNRLNPFGRGIEIDLEGHFRQLEKSGMSSEIIATVKLACEIYRNVARNCNTPIETLLTLGSLFPADFINNPILPHLILENPKFIDLNYYTQIAVANHPDTPIEILQYLLEFGRYGLRKNIAMHPNTSVEMLEQMANYSIENFIGNDETPVGIAENPKTPTHILEKLGIYRENIITDTIWFRDDKERIKDRLGRAIADRHNTPE